MADMKNTSTGREDILVKTSALDTEKPYRLALVGKHSDYAYKALTRDQMIDLARALLIAAEHPAPFTY